MSLFKNEVGRPSNETIKKRNIFKGICVLLVIVVIGLVGYILNDKGIITFNKPSQNKNDKIITTTKKQDEEKNVTATKENNSSANEKIALELFDNMNYLTNTLSVLNSNGKMDYWSYFYTFDKIKLNDVDNDMKLALAFSRYFVDDFGFTFSDMEKRNEAEQKILKHVANSSKINEKYKQLFGENIIDYNINVAVLGFSVKYNSSNKNYSFDYAGVGDAGGANVITKVIDTKIKNDKIEVFNKALFAAGFVDGVGIYKNVRLDDFNKLNKECEKSNDLFCYFGVLDKIDFFEDLDASNLSSLPIENYINDLNTFKWTFVKNQTGNYVFESVEKVK